MEPVMLNLNYDSQDKYKLVIKVVSDVHLEFLPNNYYSIPEPTYHKKNNGVKTCCLLAGDIGYPMEDYYKRFLMETREKFDLVVVIAGNHEYYKQKGKYWTMSQIENQIKKVCQETDCYFLQKSGLTYNGVRFIGTTLWSYIPSEYKYQIELGINDFKNILINDSAFNSNDFNRIHQEHCEYIRQEIEKYQNIPIIIITHHAPILEMVQNKYRNSIYTYAFASNNFELFKEPVKLWVNGHLHNSKKLQFGPTLCLSNCKGYSSAYKGYSPENPEYNENLEILL